MGSEAPERHHHPLLMGGGRSKEKVGHGYSSHQMECLSAICGTFIGPVPLEAAYVVGKGDPPNKHLHEFCEASGSENGVPEEEKVIENGFQQRHRK